MKLENYKSIPFTYQPSKRVSNIITDVDEFNEIIAYCQSYPTQYELTEHGAIRTKLYIRNGWCWDNKNNVSNNTFAIILIENGRLYQFTFWPGKRKEEEEHDISGLDALRKFKENCGEIAEKYALTNNDDIAKIKKFIQKPLISLTSIGNLLKDTELKNIKHLDIHSAYPAFLCKTYPEFYDYFHNLYVGRHEHPEYKCYLNFCIGAMQSLKILGRRYPELSKAGVNGTRNYILELTEKMRKQGFSIIGYNTDGIFYSHPDGLDYHDENEGDDMGQWSTDHHFEKIRFKSAGAYEYIENGEYHAVVRGIPKEISKNFTWGDIYKHHPKNYVLLNNKVVEVEIDETSFE